MSTIEWARAGCVEVEITTDHPAHGTSIGAGVLVLVLGMEIAGVIEARGVDEIRAFAARIIAACDAFEAEQDPTHQEPAEHCRRCGVLGGYHGLVHVRHGNGGGHNEPCPLSPQSSDQDA